MHPYLTQPGFSGYQKGRELLSKWCNSNGIVYPEVFLPYWERGGTAYDLGNSRVTGVHDEILWSDSGITPATNDDFIALPNNFIGGAAEFTILTMVYRPSLASDGTLFDMSYPGQYWQNTCYHNNSGVLTWATRDTSTGVTGSRNNDITASIPFATYFGKFVDVAFRYSSVAGNKEILINGVTDGSTSTSVDPLTNDSTITGELMGGYYNDCLLPMTYFYVWTQYLSINQINLIQASPFEMLRPNHGFNFDVAGGGPGPSGLPVKYYYYRRMRAA